MPNNEGLITIELTADEAQFVREGIQAVPLSGTSQELLPVLAIIAEIHRKLRESAEAEEAADVDLAAQEEGETEETK